MTLKITTHHAFTVVGMPFHQAYDKLLPSSSYRRAPGPKFELYDERFDPNNVKTDMSINIPVEKK